MKGVSSHRLASLLLTLPDLPLRLREGAEDEILVCKADIGCDESVMVVSTQKSGQRIKTLKTYAILKPEELK